MAPGGRNALTPVRWPETSRILDVGSDPEALSGARSGGVYDVVIASLTEAVQPRVVGSAAAFVGSLVERLDRNGVIVLLADDPSEPAELHAALSDHGIGAVRTFHLFPDAQHVSVILSEPAAADQSLAEFCAQVTGRAATAGGSQRGSHDVLVVAGRSAAALDRVVEPGVVAWRFTHSARRSLWQDVRSFHVVAGTVGIAVRVTEPHSTTARLDWLSRHRRPMRWFIPGRVVRDVVVAAYRQGDLEEVATSLRSWRSWLVAHTISRPGADGVSHPFALGFDESRFLPPEFLDVNLTNFVEAVDGTLHFIDDEWRADGGVSLNAVCLRGLWYLARELMREPGRPTDVRTVSELSERLCALADVPWSDRLITDVLLPAEAELQHLVSGRDPGVVLTELRASHRRADQPVPVRYESGR